MAAQTDRGVPLSTLSRKYLFSNSTSHIWPFSAIAELIDNACDPDVQAKQFWIDRILIKDEECLSFMDNGNGVDNQTMHKMLSFGYSDKTEVADIKPIGIYGNGFKSGSMRLGKDAIVFSKSKNASCVGMLSQTYLEEIDANQICIPIVSFQKTQNNQFSVREDQKASLRDILQYSPFKTQEELQTEIDAISSPGTNSQTGTRIIIWNLRKTSSGIEFDFKTDPYDIRIPSEVYEPLNDPSQHTDKMASHVPESVYSLRAYCTILYLKPRMQVIVRGEKVKSQLIAKSLACIRKDHYKPLFLNGESIPITFGYNTKSKDQYGVMMYHKNRLIKAYERVSCQMRANNIGVGVIGVVECNFLEPTHNKQSFLESDKYRKTMVSLAIKLEEYWKEMRFCKSKENPGSRVQLEEKMKRPDQNWAQCDECLKWRKLPDGIDCNKLPEKWFCHMNPNPQFRNCTVPEEPEDPDDDESYCKTYKKQEKEERKKKIQKQEDLAELHRKNEALRQTEEQLKQQIQEDSHSRPSQSPLQASTKSSRTRLILVPVVSHTAASTSTGLPVISNVCSLSGESQRKRPHPVTSQEMAKKPKQDEFCNYDPNASSTTHSPQCVPAVTDQQNIDDDIFILEGASTPKPVTIHAIQQDTCENVQSDEGISMLLEGADDVPVDDPQEAKGPKMVEMGTQSTCGIVNQDKLKQETNTDSENQGIQVKENGLSHNPESEKVTGSSSDEKSSLLYPLNVTEIQNQQDMLLELMQSTAQERDALKGQVHQLECRLQDAQTELQEMCTRKVKTESSHQACQTEDTDEKDFRSLFEKARQREEETSRSLRELRQNIGRILISYVPVLDLDQVNYDCNVIDEILEQVLSDIDQTTEQED